MAHRFRETVPGLAIACGTVVLLAMVLALLLTRGDVEADLSGFVPAHGHGGLPEGLQTRLQAGLADRQVLAGIQGGDAGARAAASHAFAEALREHDGIARVVNGGQTADNDALGTVAPYRYLLSPRVNVERFQQDALRDALEGVRQELASPLGPVDRDRLRADPTGELDVLADQWQIGDAPETHDRAWISADGAQALLAITLDEDQSGAGTDARTLSRLRQTFHRAAGSDELQLILTGQPVFTVDARERIRAAIRNLSVVGTLLLVGLLLWAYRSLAVVPLVAVPLLSALVTGTALVVLLFGTIHGITLAFGCTLLGVAVDYAVHLFSHRRIGEPSAVAARRIWPTIRLGAITTMLGYGAMLLADVPGLVQLGVFAVGGLAGAAVTTRLLLPALTPNAPTPQPSPPRWLTVPSPAWGGGALLLVALVSALVLIARGEFLWDDSPAAMNPVPPTLQAQDARLRAALGIAEPGHLAVVAGDDVQQILVRLEALEPGLRELVAAGVIAGAEHPGRILPSRATQRQRRDSLPGPTVLRERLVPLERELGFREGAFQPFVDDVAAARELAPMTLQDLAGTPMERRLEAGLVEVDGRQWGIVRFHGVRSAERLADWARQHAGVRYADLGGEAEAALIRLRTEILTLSGLGAMLMLGVLAVGQRSLRRGILVLAPALLAALATMAIHGAAGIAMSVFHLVSLLLVVGLSLDYALFFQRRPEDGIARAQTRRALLVCAVSTVTMFTVLATSDIGVLRAIGGTVGLGAALGLMFGWLAAETPRRGEGPSNARRPVPLTGRRPRRCRPRP